MNLSERSRVILSAWIFMVAFLCFFSEVFALEKNEIHRWSPDEIEMLKSLWIGSLPPLPKDPSNKYEDDPRAVRLGRKFFFDSRFSGNLKVSCATCHPAESNFVDDLPLAHGMGTTTRRTMPLIGAAYQTWFFWDGRTDSLWALALSPPKSALEHGITRTYCVHLISDHYRKEYEEVFGKMSETSEKTCPAIAKPDPKDEKAYEAWLSMPFDTREEITRIYVNMGKAIAAFVRTIVPGPSRFDEYVEAVLRGDRESQEKKFSENEISGLRLFIGKAKCINCHSGPLLTNGEFSDLDMPKREGLPQDNGRADGLQQVKTHEFNCLSKYSDAKPEECTALRFIDDNREKYVDAFKIPTLRNVAERSPYMHAGQLSSLYDVLVFYDVWPELMTGPPELEHPNLTGDELKQLETFLRTLSGPLIFASD